MVPTRWGSLLSVPLEGLTRQAVIRYNDSLMRCIGVERLCILCV